MSLKDRISDEIKTAMKAKDKLRLETVRGIKKVIIEKESTIRADGREELTEEEQIEVLNELAPENPVDTDDERQQQIDLLRQLQNR